jgi:ABC-type transport system substrate-binding protein
MRSAVVFGAILAAVLLVASASGSAAVRSGATPAAAPFAEAWASVPASVAARRARNAVVVAFPQDIGGRLGGSDIAGDVIRGAFRQNGHGVWVKDLVADAKADSVGVSYSISPKAFWYWGGRKVPVTYRDFVYTLQQLDDPANNELPGAGMGNLDPARVTHRGLRQVTFPWRTTGCSSDLPCGPYANWRSLFGTPTLLYPSFALTGLDFTKIWTTCVCGTDGKPVSDGPFYVAAYTPGQGSVLKPNPYWGGKKPALAEIDNRIVTDQNALVEAMRLGVIDVTYSAARPSLTVALAALAGTPGITTGINDVSALELLWFREGDAPGAPGMTKGSSNALLRAPWMRQAIGLGLDRQAALASVYGRLPQRIDPGESLLFRPGQAGYRPDFARWDYDPRKALAILKAHCTSGSGPNVPDPANTKIWQCAGLPATFRWTWRIDNVARTTIEQLAKAELRSIGIALVERPLPANIIFTPAGIFSGDFDIAELASVTSGDPGDWTPVYACRGGGNYLGFCSAKVDALLAAGNAELDPEKRLADYQSADKLLSESVPVLPLFRPLNAIAHNSDLLGVTAHTFGLPEYWHWRR